MPKVGSAAWAADQRSKALELAQLSLRHLPRHDPAHLHSRRTFLVVSTFDQHFANGVFTDAALNVLRYMRHSLG
jgi:hypothetical protein